MRVPTAVAIATKIAMAAGDKSLRSTLLVLVYLFAQGALGIQPQQEVEGNTVCAKTARKGSARKS